MALRRVGVRCEAAPCASANDAFVFQKFSVDPEGKHMMSKPGTRAKTFSWKGFFMTDSELATIVDRVITAYIASQSSSRSSGSLL